MKAMVFSVVWVLILDYNMNMSGWEDDVRTSHLSQDGSCILLQVRMPARGISTIHHRRQSLEHRYLLADWEVWPWSRTLKPPRYCSWSAVIVRRNTYKERKLTFFRARKICRSLQSHESSISKRKLMVQWYDTPPWTEWQSNMPIRTLRM